MFIRRPRPRLPAKRLTCCRSRRFSAGKPICCAQPRKPVAPWDVRNIAEKLAAFGNSQFCFTERGTTFGYNNLVADMRSLYWMRQAGYRVIFDATHSVQRPSGAGDSTSGDGTIAPILAREAMAE